MRSFTNVTTGAVSLRRQAWSISPNVAMKRRGYFLPTSWPFPIVMLAFVMVTASGCNEYWWSRGQTTPPAALAARADSRLTDARSAKAYPRNDILASTTEIQSALRPIWTGKLEDRSGVVAALKRAEGPFRGLEGRLSYGSRPAYGELCGQLRTLSGQLETAPDSAVSDSERSSLNLFSARTLFFLADELSVPAPVAPASAAG